MSSAFTQLHIPAPYVPLFVRLVEGRVRAGFPSPADDFDITEIDIARELVTHPQATFFLKASGMSMIGAGINDGDILVVNRALEAKPGHVVVAIIDNEFTVKYLRMRAGRPFLEPANPTFPCIFPRGSQQLEVWGVVTCSVTRFTRN